MLAKLFSKFHRQKTREIPLEELSVFWMDNPVRSAEPDTTPALPADQDSADIAETSPAQEPEKSWKHTEINNFHVSYIMPHTRIMESAALIAINEVLTVLDGPDGDCPSVLREDEETPVSYRSLTSTLREHSLDVAREAYDILKKNDNLLLIGKVLVAALGHDLGKIPNRSEEEKLINLHAYRSAKILEPIVKNLQYRENILAAVQYHHLHKSELKKMDDNTVFILRQADWQARKKEFAHSVFSLNTAEKVKSPDKVRAETSPGPAKPFQLTADSLILTIKPFISMNGIDSAFFFKDTVYVQPDWLKGIIAEKSKSAGDQEIADIIARNFKCRVLEYRVHFKKDIDNPPIDIKYYAFNIDLFGDAEDIKKRSAENEIIKTIKSVK